jgi:peptidoglycan/xylan/chitin deacetylase (PgdA/CDA1 family)
MRRELVLNFHGIGVPHPGVGPEERAVWMSRENFIGLVDHIAALGAATPTPIAITFDDGNFSDVAIALPELCRRRLAATFFVCAGRLETPEYLGRDAIRDLLGAGMKIGSHGMHHRDWRKLDETALAEEIGTARKHLEDACGAPVTTAAIPFGSYDRRVLSRLRAEGFACVYTSDRGFACSEAWLKPRNTLGAGAKRDDIARLLKNERWPGPVLRDARMFFKRLR